MPPTPNLPATPKDDDAYYRAVLHDLIDRGADLARRLHEQATAQLQANHAAAPATPAPDPTIAFDRIARAVRRTIALARHIAAAPAQRATAPAARQHARAQIIRHVEDAIHRRHRETDAEALYNELSERLDDPELELDLAGRPVDEIIEEICRDLGVAVQARSYIYKRRTPHEIAHLRARAAAPPSPGLQLIQGGRLSNDQPRCKGPAASRPSIPI